MKVLGIDQSYSSTAFCVMDNDKIIEVGNFATTKQECAKADSQRIAIIGEKIKNVLETHSPDITVIEYTQFQKDPKTLIRLSMLMGYLVGMVETNGYFVITVEPSVWKSHFGVRGKKREEQKQSSIEIVKERYGLDVNDDVADAIGIASYAKVVARME